MIAQGVTYERQCPHWIRSRRWKVGRTQVHTAPPCFLSSCLLLSSYLFEAHDSTPPPSRPEPSVRRRAEYCSHVPESLGSSLSVVQFVTCMAVTQLYLSVSRGQFCLFWIAIELTKLSKSKVKRDVKFLGKIFLWLKWRQSIFSLQSSKLAGM